MQYNNIMVDVSLFIFIHVFVQKVWLSIYLWQQKDTMNTKRLVIIVGA